MKKDALITIVNDIELIKKIKDILNNNNIEYEDEMETREWYSKSTKGVRYTKHVDYIITIYVKENDMEKALSINEIADIVYGHDQDIIDNVDKEIENGYEEIDNKEADSEEEYEDKISKYSNLFGKICLYALYLGIAIAIVVAIIRK